MRVKTSAVYSQLAMDEEVPDPLRRRLPAGMRLSRHQVDTYRALVESDAEVVFNTAMTGDGKSLAGQLPALVAGEGWRYPMMAAYPTNELVEDQLAHLESVETRWQARIERRRLNSAELDRAMTEEDYARRGEALMGLLRNADFVLTNPDILHYVMHQFYTWPEDAPDRYAGPLTQKFRQLIFDEFHIFDAPQIVSVMNTLLFMRAIAGEARAHKFLFLSATPRPLLREYLERSGLRAAFIESRYATDGSPDEWRRILHPTIVNFEKEPRAEAWLETHAQDTVLPFFLERRPCARGAVIVNSRAAALRIYERLRPVFEQHGLSVALNTGWTGRARRRASYEADLLIGTSTVDVGVDFQINFLVFESDSAGTFLQRLGRLGRHDGFAQNGLWRPFHDFVAYALLPDWLVARLFEGENAPLRDASELDRPTFNRAIEQVFPTPTDFEHYARLWGRFQTVKILLGMCRKPVREQYKETRRALQQQYEATFGVYLSRALGEYNQMKTEQPALLDEALAFRGSTLFPCCVIDRSEPPGEQFKVVDLPAAIAGHELACLSADDFYAAVQREGLDRRLFEKQDCLGFFYLGAPRDFQRFRFHLHADMASWGEDQFGRAVARKGFSLAADFPGAAEINSRLRRRLLPALLCAGRTPLELKRRLSLPLLFPLYEFESDDGLTGTVAFGRAALLLDARLRYHPMSCGGGTVIV